MHISFNGQLIASTSFPGLLKKLVPFSPVHFNKQDCKLFSPKNTYMEARYRFWLLPCNYLVQERMIGLTKTRQKSLKTDWKLLREYGYWNQSLILRARI